MIEHVTHDGLRFRCRVDGPASAPWIVFSNSLLTDLTLWDHQVAHLAGRARILRYDQRGHGGTAVPPGPATLPQLAADAAALMAHFGVHDATFVGASIGAATGLCLVGNGEDRITRLVAADGNAATPPGGAEAWETRIEAARRDGMPAFAEQTLARWFATRSLAEHHPALAAVRAMIVATPFDGFLACARALQSYDVRPGLAAIGIPTLLIAGGEDGVMPRSMATLQAAIHGARLVVIPEAGHLPCIEQPAAFNAAFNAALATALP